VADSIGSSCTETNKKRDNKNGPETKGRSFESSPEPLSINPQNKMAGGSSDVSSSELFADETFETLD